MQRLHILRPFSTKRMERYFALYPGDEVKAICHYECNLMLWNLARVEEIHADMLKVIGWMNRDLPEWVKAQERFETVCDEIRRRMDWQ